MGWCRLVRKEDRWPSPKRGDGSLSTGTHSRHALNLSKFTFNFSPFCICNDVLKWQRIYFVNYSCWGVWEGQLTRQCWELKEIREEGIEQMMAVMLYRSLNRKQK